MGGTRRGAGSDSGGTAQQGLGLRDMSAKVLISLLVASTPGIAAPLLAHADTWQIVPSDNVSASQGTFLQGVSCVATGPCWAAGYYEDANNVAHTLVEHSTGADFTTVGSPNVNEGTENNFLRGVTCLTDNECWAVGNHFNPRVRPSMTLAEHYDGTTWTVVTTPSPSAVSNVLYSVSCPAPLDCWAVGVNYISDTSTVVTTVLLEHYDGSSWSVTTTPNATSDTENWLQGVTCSAPNDCWAVGHYATHLVINSNVVVQTLIEHYNGLTWSIVPSANTDSIHSNLLESVSCTLIFCLADGYTLESFSPSSCCSYHPLAEVDPGSGWVLSQTDDPASSSGNNAFYGVSCGISDHCWAVGCSGTQPFIDQYNGSSWTLDASPNTGTNTSNCQLQGIGCTVGKCVAVGTYYLASPANGGWQTLVEEDNTAIPGAGVPEAPPGQLIVLAVVGLALWVGRRRPRTPAEY
jgi:hypothetical protein